MVALRTIVGAAGALVAATAASLLGPGAAAASPNPGLNNFLLGVGAASPDDVWAVGNAEPSSGGTRSLTLHWNGSSWTRRPSPTVGSATALVGVKAMSRRNAWAVGSSDLVRQQTLYTHTLALRWNGTRWRRVSTPHPGIDSYLVAVAGRPRSLWAAGNWLGAGGQRHGLILHWDGSRWARARTPALPPRSRLTSLDALSARDVWAAGDVFTDASGYRPLLLHWDGARWRVIPVPQPAGTSEVDAMAATSSTDVWMGGQGLLHWDGSALAQVMGNGRSVMGLDAFGPADAWLVGSCWTCVDAGAMHWDGTRWTSTPTPNPGNLVNTLNAVAGPSRSDLWAVGEYLRVGGRYRTLVLHWNGASWTRY